MSKKLELVKLIQENPEKELIFFTHPDIHEGTEEGCYGVGTIRECRVDQYVNYSDKMYTIKEHKKELLEDIECALADDYERDFSDEEYEGIQTEAILVFEQLEKKDCIIVTIDN